MIRATHFALSLALMAAPAAGQGLESWLAAVAKAEKDFDAACEALRASDPPLGLVWLRLGPKGVEIAPADEDAAAAAAFWAEAALGAKAAAEALYGQAAGAGLDQQPVMIETGPAGVSVNDGGGLDAGDPCDALRRMVPALGGARAGGDPFADARATAAERIALAIGGGAAAPLSAPPPPGAHARGPDGVSVEIETGEDGAAFVTMMANSDAAPGETSIRIYAPGDPFRPIETLPISILPGPDAAPAATAATLAPGGEARGVLSVGGEARLAIEVTEPQRLTFLSTGASDLSARLEAADGSVIAANDDTGSGYEFSIAAELKPGGYFLSLSHCCGGGGAFHISADPK